MHLACLLQEEERPPSASALSFMRPQCSDINGCRCLDAGQAQIMSKTKAMLEWHVIYKQISAAANVMGIFLSADSAVIVTVIISTDRHATPAA